MVSRRLLLGLALIATLAGCSPKTEPAAPADQGNGAPTEASGSPRARPGRGLQPILDQLDLTADQKDKIEAIRAKHKEDGDRKAIYQETLLVLTPEQQTKMKELMAARRHRRRPRADQSSAAADSSASPAAESAAPAAGSATPGDSGSPEQEDQ